MEVAQVLIDGAWRKASEEGTFHAWNPATGEALPMLFPVSAWADCEAALAAASRAAHSLSESSPEQIAAFLDDYAARIESASDEIAAAASEETGLPVTPRLKEVELPRTTNQLRQAAQAAREESWKRPTLDLERNIRSCLAPIGPVVVFGPNNFPLAFNGISGGDFAAAIAAGNPVIAKAHPLHPNTTRLLAEHALKAVTHAGLPSATVQMIYQIGNENGLKLVSDTRVGAVGFTGSRAAGMHLKKAAEATGKPIYLEMSSINPVIFLPGALAEKEEQLAKDLVDSCLAASGQFCTSPNLILLWQNEQAEFFLQRVAKTFQERAPQTLLSANGRAQLAAGVKELRAAGANLITGGEAVDGSSSRYANTLLRASGSQFMAQPDALQREVFGNATLAVTVSGLDDLIFILDHLEGNLTGTIYSAVSGADDDLYRAIEPHLRRKVGRLLNDKMPTGVAVSPAMNHGGPFPATSHPGFTSVGIPGSLARFAVLQCYDGVRQDRLPSVLRDQPINPLTWRSIHGDWVRA